MTRLEYIVPGGLRLRFVNIPPFGRILMPPSGFYFPLLTGKTVLGVYKDGIGATKIINSDTIFSPVPTGKHVTFNTSYGTIYFSDVFEGGETMIILYQDTPP